MMLTDVLAASITFYMIFATEFIIHYLLDRPLHKSEQRRARGELTKKTKLMLMGLVFSSILIYIRYAPPCATLSVSDSSTDSPYRSIYRTIELADGFRGYIMSIERYFGTYQIFKSILPTHVLTLSTRLARRWHGHPGNVLDELPAPRSAPWTSLCLEERWARGSICS